jgi:holliday junction DNA helicase RuvA
MKPVSASQHPVPLPLKGQPGTIKGMIKQVTGIVLSTEPGGCVIDVAGWGVFLHTPTTAQITLGERVTLLTYMAVKQDGIELYGFTDSNDRTFFELLLTVSGVGPKTALSILTKAPRESLENAIATRDISYLTRVAGMSKKAAEKISVELSEKIIPSGETQGTTDSEVLDTLIALGYTEREARSAIARVPLHISGRDERLKAALSNG